MTYFDIMLLLLLLLSFTWSGIITVYALYMVKKCKGQVAYYQQPETQIKIHEHVLRNRRFQNGGEVFR